MESVRSKINGNEQRLAMMKRDLKNMREMQLERLQNELEGMTAEMNMLPVIIFSDQRFWKKKIITPKSAQLNEFRNENSQKSFKNLFIVEQILEPLDLLLNL